MKPLWALVGSILSFFFITGVAFSISPGSPLSSEPVALQFGAHCTLAQMKQVGDFYGVGPQPPSALNAYLNWLGHGFSGQWEPQVWPCTFQFLSGEPSQLDFWLAIAVWIVFTAAIVSFALWFSMRAQSIPSN